VDCRGTGREVCARYRNLSRRSYDILWQVDRTHATCWTFGPSVLGFFHLPYFAGRPNGTLQPAAGIEFGTTTDFLPAREGIPHLFQGRNHRESPHSRGAHGTGTAAPRRYSRMPPLANPDISAVPLVAAPGECVAVSRSRRVARVQSRASHAMVLSGCLVLILAVQVYSRAYLAEPGSYSDDVSHLMNGLVLRDYLTTGLGHDPMAFAEGYYASYPKIAPLMWPPLFHVALGVFLLPGWPAGAAALVFVGLIATWLGWRLNTIARTLCGGTGLWLVPILVLTTPMVAALFSVVMLDIAIAALSLEACYWLARYWRSESTKHAALFGLFVAFACLTKGNGVALVLAPAALIAVTGRFDMLRRPGLYWAALIVATLALPLLAMSARNDAAIGDFGFINATEMLRRVTFYSTHLWRQLGPAVLTFAAFGVIATLRRRRDQDNGAVLAAALLAVLMASAAFHILMPVKAAVTRYLTVAIGPIVVFAFLGAWDAARRVYPVYWRTAAFGFLTVLIVVATLAARPGVRIAHPLGYRGVVAAMANAGELPGRRVLIVGDEIGEGAFVAEAAMAHLTTPPTIVRGSKFLASDTWNGHNFRMTYSSPDDLYRDLRAYRIEYVVIDHSEQSLRLAYFDQVRVLTVDRLEAVRSGLSDGSAARQIVVFRVPLEPAAGAPPPLPTRPTFGRASSR
jgi:hypothetical protein